MEWQLKLIKRNRIVFDLDTQLHSLYHDKYDYIHKMQLNLAAFYLL